MSLFRVKFTMGFQLLIQLFSLTKAICQNNYYIFYKYVTTMTSPRLQLQEEITVVF